MSFWPSIFFLLTWNNTFQIYPDFAMYWPAFCLTLTADLSCIDLRLTPTSCRMCSKKRISEIPYIILRQHKIQRIFTMQVQCKCSASPKSARNAFHLCIYVWRHTKPTNWNTVALPMLCTCYTCQTKTTQADHIGISSQNRPAEISCKESRKTLHSRASIIARINRITNPETKGILKCKFRDLCDQHVKVWLVNLKTDEEKTGQQSGLTSETNNIPIVLAQHQTVFWFFCPRERMWLLTRSASWLASSQSMPSALAPSVFVSQLIIFSEFSGWILQRFTLSMNSGSWSCCCAVCRYAFPLLLFWCLKWPSTSFTRVQSSH